jgi:hypothetical protein
MGASQYNFSIEQGSSFKMSLIYKDSNGDPIDITGWCARLTWRTSANATQVFNSDNIDKSVYDFNIEGNLGKINFLLPAATTNALDFNTAKYDLELQSDEDHYNQGGKFVIRLLYGTLTIQKRYSKYENPLECNE